MYSEFEIISLESKRTRKFNVSRKWRESSTRVWCAESSKAYWMTDSAGMKERAKGCRLIDRYENF